MTDLLTAIIPAILVIIVACVITPKPKDNQDSKLSKYLDYRTHTGMGTIGGLLGIEKQEDWERFRERED